MVRPPAIAIIVALAIAGERAADAHGFGGSGLVHPLTGIDHLVAMLAVGAWSAQLGGRAIIRVPAAFVACMTFGGILGIARFTLPRVEAVIASSVIILGFAIASDRRIPTFVAGAAVALFGTYHGFAHGTEVTGVSSHASYIAGFVVTTAGLHVIGAVSALLALESPRGASCLRYSGLAAMLIGVWLLFR